MPLINNTVIVSGAKKWYNVNMKLPSYVKKYFWDADVNKLDMPRQADYVIARLLQYGDIRSMRWLFRHTDKEDVRRAIINRRGIPARSLCFWTLFFNIPKHKVKCLSKSYQNRQKTIWPY